MIKTKDIVSLHYTVATQDGVELDSSDKDQGMLVMVGSRVLIEGLEQALIGKQKGDVFAVTLPPEKAYGPRYDNLVQTVPIDMFDGLDVQAGMSFRATTDDGEQSVIVVEVTDEYAMVDGNHPLAGVTLSFNVEILDVRPATEMELEQGKACSADCCQH